MSDQRDALLATALLNQHAFDPDESEHGVGSAYDACLDPDVLVHCEAIDALVNEDNFLDALEYALTMPPAVCAHSLVQRKLQIIRQKTGHLQNRNAYYALYERTARIWGFVGVETPTVQPRYLWLQGELARSEGIRSICDVGCHKGEFCVALGLQRYDVTGVDVADYNVDFAGKVLRQTKLDTHCRVMQGFAEDLDQYFSNGAFDAATVFELLEHVKDPALVLSKVEKIVRPGGSIFLTVPYGAWESDGKGTRYTDLTPQEHVRSFTKEKLHQLLGRKQDAHAIKLPFAHGLGWFCVRYVV